jgi:hypothetical protein
MANGFSVRDYLDSNNASVSASSTTAITRSFPMSSEDSRNCLVQVTFSLVEETNAITLTLQDSYDGGTTWAAVKSATAVATTKGVQTLTFDTKANTGDGDYVVVYDTSGTAWAVAADKTGSSAEPTGAIWTAIPAANKAQADISGDTTAANVAASFETAFDGITGFTAVITSDDTAADGTMSMTQIKGGTIDDVVVKDENDAGAGTISAANTTPGAATLVYEIENNIYDGTDTAIWPLARVICTTGAGDTATVSNVYVSRRY